MDKTLTTEKNYFVYILRCQNSSYYVGSSKNLSRRIAEHSAGYGCESTSIRKFDQLVYFETYPSKEEALRREKQLKGWSRNKKEALITKNLSKVKSLSISHQSPRYNK